MSDSALRQDIIDELDFEPSIDAADIGVAVENGIVTLSGHVATYVQKEAAEKVVRRVKGVKGIAEEIEVRPAGTHRTADDEIAKRAVDSINWSTSIPDGAVQVTVQQGHITLRGEVGWWYQQTAAADAVKGLAGVTAVSNHIDIKPRASAGDVRKRIEEAFKRNAEVEAQEITVDVLADGKVRLEGKVKLWSERRAAERAAWSAPGVKSVEDRITVG